MTADIITIGDEILNGQIQNTNSEFIAAGLLKIGILVRKMHSVRDTEPEIIQSLDESMKHSAVTILTGGLGPTSDDITRNTLAHYFNSNMIMNEEVLKQIIGFFKDRGMRTSQRNKEQALVPHNCRVLRNTSGTAPGIVFRKEDKMVVALPGVPFEMKTIFSEELIPLFKKTYILPVLLHKTILTTGIAESNMADLLENWENENKGEFRIAYLPSPGILKLRISISGKNSDELNKKLKYENQKIVDLIGEEYVFGCDDDTLEQVTGMHLLQNKLTLALAESCTGGMVSELIASVPGASGYFKGSVICYANEIKTDLLKIPQDVIATNGTVSKEVVELMAVEVRKLMNSDLSVAVSGIAGPSGGSDEKPVGTTWIAVATPQGVFSNKYLFGENRSRNITRAAISALNMLRNAILRMHENNK